MGSITSKTGQIYTSLLLITQMNISPLTELKCIGHIEPSIDHMLQTAINSHTTQKMIDKHVQSDTFTPPLIPAQVMWGNQSTTEDF